MPLTPYKKPWLSHADLVQQLVNRGLVVSDPAAAAQYLAHVNYYRLSGYCLAFEIPNQRHSFTLGTTFEQLRAAYDFGFTIRDLASEALEVLEIDIRTTVAHHLGEKYGAFGHTDPVNFYRRPQIRSKDPRQTFDHAAWITRLRESVYHSKEPFVEHFRRSYTQSTNGDLPIWTLSEVMSFGSVSRMIDGMISPDQRAIASRYGLQNRNLVSWIHHLSVARNVCAHHGRLWDRLWTSPAEIPAGNAWRPPHLINNQRITMTLLILYHMLKRIPDVVDWAAHWQVRLRKKLALLPESAVTPRLGFTDSWFANPVWC